MQTFLILFTATKYHPHFDVSHLGHFPCFMITGNAAASGLLHGFCAVGGIILVQVLVGAPALLGARPASGLRAGVWNDWIIPWQRSHMLCRWQSRSKSCRSLWVSSYWPVCSKGSLTMNTDEYLAKGNWEGSFVKRICWQIPLLAARWFCCPSAAQGLPSSSLWQQQG